LRIATVALLAASAALQACGGGSPTRLDLEPVAHPLVDNFFVAKAGAGGSASMGGAVGRFALEDRCLVLRIDGAAATPIFAGRTRVTATGIVAGGREIPYGSEVTLPMIGGGMRVETPGNDSCPRDAVAIRAIQG
jgi:hypothetical protein